MRIAHWLGPGKEENRMLMTMSKGNAYDVAMENFDTAADAMGLNTDAREMIKYPERSIARCAGPPRAGFAFTRRYRSTR